MEWNLADAQRERGLGFVVGAVADLQIAVDEVKNAIAAVRTAEESPLLEIAPSHSFDHEQPSLSKPDRPSMRLLEHDVQTMKTASKNSPPRL